MPTKPIISWNDISILQVTGWIYVDVIDEKGPLNYQIHWGGIKDDDKVEE